jgi:hypothetical protein
LIIGASAACAEGLNGPQGGEGGSGGGGATITSQTSAASTGPGPGATTTAGMATCGNGMVDTGEECDGADLGPATCVTEGFAGGALACSDTCTLDTAGCMPNFTEGFEGTGLPAGFTTSGDATWLLDTSTFHGGAKSARSGDIDDYESSSGFLSLQFDVAGSISFWHRESTETCCDFLELYIDGLQQGSWTSDFWQQSTFPVSAGMHTFEWRYTKDLSISSGADAVWVDDVAATNGYLP